MQLIWEADTLFGSNEDAVRFSATGDGSVVNLRARCCGSNANKIFATITDKQWKSLLDCNGEPSLALLSKFKATDCYSGERRIDSYDFETGQWTD